MHSSRPLELAVLDAVRAQLTPGVSLVVLAAGEHGLVAARDGDGSIARFDHDGDDPDWYPDLASALDAPLRRKRVEEAR